jgi:hypothetical protein
MGEGKPSLLRRVVNGRERFYRSILDQLNNTDGRVIVIGLVIGIIAFVLFGSMTNTPAKHFAENKIRLVAPGHYAPIECSDWNFGNSKDAEYLKHALDRMLSLSESDQINPLTTAHVNLGFCGLIYNQTVMLNPRLISTEGQPENRTIGSRLLCGEKSTFNYVSKQWSVIELQFKDEDENLFEQKYKEADAQKLQIALSILRGESICGKEVNTSKKLA